MRLICAVSNDARHLDWTSCWNNELDRVLMWRAACCQLWSDEKRPGGGSWLDLLLWTVCVSRGPPGTWGCGWMLKIWEQELHFEQVESSIINGRLYRDFCGIVCVCMSILLMSDIKASPQRRETLGSTQINNVVKRLGYP